MNYKQKKIKELEKLQNNKVFNESLYKLNDIKTKVSLEWGKERIMNLISPELLLRFKRADNKYTSEYHASFNKVKLNEMMVRAYEALIQDAIDRGYNTLSPEFIFTYHPDTNEKIIICVNEDDVPIAFEKYKSKENVIIFHIKEILILMDQGLFDIKKKTHKLGGRILKYESINT